MGTHDVVAWMQTEMETLKAKVEHLFHHLGSDGHGLVPAMPAPDYAHVDAQPEVGHRDHGDENDPV